MLNYSNPRTVAEFNDWPSGRHRVKCRFHVEWHPKRGFRVGRTTINPKTGLWNAAKYTTYSGPAAIVDGSDGKTYILQYVPDYDFVTIYRHDFMAAGPSVFPSNPDRFNLLMDVIKATPKQGV